jgi:hypothetical protein
MAVGLGGSVALSVANVGNSTSPRPTTKPATLVGQTADAAVLKAPMTPPAKICGSSHLDGPSTRPRGAVAVRTSTNLVSLVNAKPSGTVFWLTPGIHRLGNGIYDNIEPKTNDRFIGAPGAIISGQHRNLYAFVGHARHVTIEHLKIQDFGSPGDNNNQGVVNHDSASYWTLRWSTITNNAGAGMMIGSRNLLSHNCIKGNGQYAFNAYSASGVGFVSLTSNEIVGNNADEWERRQPGCGCSGGGKFWNTRHARIVGNYVHDNRGVGLWADTNNRDFLFRANYISDNDDEGLMYEISYNAAILYNTFIRNAIVKGPTNPGFPASAIYLSESGSDDRVAGSYGTSFVIKGNVFTDNWAGIIAWENADRFAGSPANASTGYSTLVAPRVATSTACRTPSLVKRKPYIDDCRWKTQHIVVAYNTFRLTASHIGSSCTAANGCGYNGLFSNYGSYPDWSPYQGTVVEKHITFSQHNVWSHNSYLGPWRFMVLQAGHAVSWSTWRSATYHQDAGSTKR